ncbi:hypothetical protein AB3S75_041868 [Citrus x aurantiifolia]
MLWGCNLRTFVVGVEVWQSVSTFSDKVPPKVAQNIHLCWFCAQILEVPFSESLMYFWKHTTTFQNDEYLGMHIGNSICGCRAVVRNNFLVGLN